MTTHMRWAFLLAVIVNFDRLCHPPKLLKNARIVVEIGATFEVDFGMQITMSLIGKSKRTGGIMMARW